jgi:prevent-host-death family protein
MKLAISVTDLMRNFADYINRVVYRGERFLLVRGGKPVAELSPLSTGARLGELPALLADLPRLPDEEAEMWAGDLERARADLDAAPKADPWGS